MSSCISPACWELSSATEVVCLLKPEFFFFIGFSFLEHYNPMQYAKPYWKEYEILV